MKKIVAFVLGVVASVVSVSAAPDIANYRPMLEQGKEWRYTEALLAGKCFPDLIDWIPLAITSSFKIDGTEIIDGKEYYVLTYTNYFFDDMENIFVAYLREDVKTGRVWFRETDAPYSRTWIGSKLLHCGIFFNSELWLEEDRSEYLLFSFYNPLSALATEELEYLRDGTIETPTGTVPTKILRFRYGSDLFALAQGIGLVKTNEYYDDPHATLFGLQYQYETKFPDTNYYNLLYEVVDEQGNVIYTNDVYRPENVGIADIEIDASAVVDVYSPTGILVKTGISRADIRTVLPSGLYIVTDGITSAKALIK